MPAPIWMVQDVSTISQFQQLFKDIPKVYVADGHHRLAAAASMQHLEPQWISTLYVTVGQLRCREFHKMILPDKPISKDQIFASIAEFFNLGEVEGNVPLKPDRKGEFGLYCHNCWYRLTLKEKYMLNTSASDVNFLQSKILEPVFGIIDPRSDLRLSSWHPGQWNDMISLLATRPHSVLFTLHPMSATELIEQAETQVVLPPKSTYIEPKVPFGLLLYNHKHLKCNEKGVCNA